MPSSHGSCLCGDVRFTVAWPSLWVAHCHCTLCQRAHGAAFATWFGMANDSVRIDDIVGSLRWYASSPGAERGFCALRKFAVLPFGTLARGASHRTGESGRRCRPHADGACVLGHACELVDARPERRVASKTNG